MFLQTHELQTSSPSMISAGLQAEMLGGFEKAGNMPIAFLLQNYHILPPFWPQFPYLCDEGLSCP